MLPETRVDMFPKTPRFVGVIRMTPDEWHAIQDNPRQRDTERHARRARHLRTPHPSHYKVSMARLPNYQQIKLDGHSRDYLWNSGEVPAPTFLNVDVWECTTIEQVLDLYTTFDSSKAVETVADKISGAYRQFAPNFKSSLLITGHIASAMRLPYGLLLHKDREEADVYEMLEYWMPELRLLDDCGPAKGRFPTGVTSGALLTFRRYGPAITAFWDRYAKNLGDKAGDAWDAVEALEKIRNAMLTKGALHGGSNIMILMRKAVSCVDAFRRDKLYTGGVKGLSDESFSEWVERAAKTRRTW